MSNLTNLYLFLSDLAEYVSDTENPRKGFPSSEIPLAVLALKIIVIWIQVKERILFYLILQLLPCCGN